jgi:hypothetical protein
VTVAGGLIISSTTSFAFFARRLVVFFIGELGGGAAAIDRAFAGALGRLGKSRSGSIRQGLFDVLDAFLPRAFSVYEAFNSFDSRSSIAS